MQQQTRLGVVLALSLIANIVLNKAPMTIQLLLVPLFMGTLIYVAATDGIHRRDIGLTKQNSKQGLLYGVAIALIILVLFCIAFVIAPTLFSDQRYNQSPQKLLVALLVILPLRTVLLEEFLFRGVYYAYFKNLKPLYSYAIPALLFGMWHIIPSLDFKRLTLPIINFIVPQALSTLGTITLTSIAGAGLLWARKRSGSLLAPVIIHYTINATAMVLAYLSFT